MSTSHHLILCNHSYRLPDLAVSDDNESPTQPLTHSPTHPPHSRSTSYYEPLNHCTDLESGIVREFTATVNRDAPYVVHTRLHNGADFSVNQLYQLDAVPALGYYHRIRNGMRIQVATTTHQCTSRVCARVNKARVLNVGVRMILVHLLLLPLYPPPSLLRSLTDRRADQDRDVTTHRPSLRGQFIPCRQGVHVDLVPLLLPLARPLHIVPVPSDRGKLAL